MKWFILVYYTGFNGPMILPDDKGFRSYAECRIYGDVNYRMKPRLRKPKYKCLKREEA